MLMFVINVVIIQQALINTGQLKYIITLIIKYCEYMVPLMITKSILIYIINIKII